jgi:hypothetical protein
LELQAAFDWARMYMRDRYGRVAASNTVTDAEWELSQLGCITLPAPFYDTFYPSTVGFTYTAALSLDGHVVRETMEATCKRQT